MKHPRQVPMPSGIQLWLEEQLHARGIDAAVYTKYLLTILSNESSNNYTKPKDNEVAILVEELSANLKKVKEKGQFPFANSTPAKSCEDSLPQPVQEKPSRHPTAIPPSSSKSKDTSSSFGSSSGIWSGKRTFGSSVGKNRTTSEGNNRDAKSNQNNNNWLEENKENNGLNRDVKEKSRSRSTVKQTPEKARTRNMAKSLDRKDFDGKSETSKSRRLYQQSNELTSDSVKALWSTEKSFDDLTGCDQDLPMDFQQLLESPEATKMMADPTRCLGTKQPSSFIQCGTNITSSIWTEKADESMDCSMTGEICGDLSLGFNKSVWGVPPNEDLSNRNEMLQESLGCFKSMDLWSNKESRMLNMHYWKTAGTVENKESWDYGKWSDVEGTTMLLNDADNFFSSIGSDLRGSLTTLNHNKEDSSFTEVIPKVSNVSAAFGAIKTKNVHHETPVNRNISPKKEEEDLLTSMKTHFRPIKQETVEIAPPTAAPTFPDGTTFPISNSLDKPDFHRSPGGGLYLDSDVNKKYMEFNESKDNPTEFVPKFKVSQNEKFCQTEEFISAPEKRAVVECEDLYFPDDEELVRNMVEEDEEVGEGEECDWGADTCIKVDGWMATWPAPGIWSNEANVQEIWCGANVWNTGNMPVVTEKTGTMKSSGGGGGGMEEGGGEQYMQLRNEWTQEAEELFSDISHHLMANYTDIQPPKASLVEQAWNQFSAAPFSHTLTLPPTYSLMQS